MFGLSGKKKQLLNGLLVIGLCFSVKYSIDFLKSYSFEKQSWQEAASRNTATSYRNYLTTYPNGRWRIIAAQRIKDLYNEATNRYVENHGYGYEQQAMNAIVQSLDYAKQTDNNHIVLAFKRHQQTSYSESTLKAQEEHFYQVLKARLETSIPNDLLSLTLEQTSDKDTVLLVIYDIKLRERLYSPEEDIRHRSAYLSPTTYPGISVDWIFGINIPTRGEIYKLQLQTEPDKVFSYKPAIGNQYDKGPIYDSMLQNALDRAENEFMQRLGVYK